MVSVLVAGGGGFVGSALVAALAGGGHDVSVMTTSSSTARHPVRVIRLDRWHPEGVAHVEPAPRYDWIFNLAAYGIDPSQNDPEASHLANAELPLAFVDLARRAGARALVHVGSAFEYAEPTGRRRLGESDPLERTKHYGASKAAGSLAVIKASRESHLNAVVARLFGVYGAGERSWRLFPSLYASLTKGQAVPLSEGSQVRDFIYVEDAAMGLASLATAISDGSQTPCIVNLCSGVEVTVRQFAETVADVLGAPRELLRFGAIPMRAHEIAYLVGDVSRLNRIMPWQPAHSLERGIGMASAELSARIRSAG
jgi:nucleoside-diphosphate-sugar epimerase